MRPCTSRTARLLGEKAAERGRTSEARVLEALALAARPEWMRGFRKGTLDEDRAGIDVVIESDVGKLFVQVKSSRGGKAAFLERRRSARVAVVVVGVTDSPERVLEKVVSEVGRLRAQFLAARQGWSR